MVRQVSSQAVVWACPRLKKVGPARSGSPHPCSRRSLCPHVYTQCSASPAPSCSGWLWAEGGGCLTGRGLPGDHTLSYLRLHPGLLGVSPDCTEENNGRPQAAQLGASRARPQTWDFALQSGGKDGGAETGVWPHAGWNAPPPPSSSGPVNAPSYLEVQESKTSLGNTVRDTSSQKQK